MGSSQPLLHAAGPALDQSCRIQQRTPLYVGFPDDTNLESFEETALASRNIVHELKHWACNESTSTAVAVPSLQLAFAQPAPLRLERVQFDDAALAHAHVVLSSLYASSGLLRWRVDLAQTTELGWVVTGTGIASATDLVDPSDETR